MYNEKEFPQGFEVVVLDDVPDFWQGGVRPGHRKPPGPGDKKKENVLEQPNHCQDRGRMIGGTY